MATRRKIYLLTLRPDRKPDQGVRDYHQKIVVIAKNEDQVFEDVRGLDLGRNGQKYDDFELECIGYAGQHALAGIIVEDILEG